MTSSLVLAAAAWAVATSGATGPRDLLVVLALLVLATVASGAGPRPDPALGVALAALLGWLLVTGPVRTGLTFEAIRLPLLVVVATLTARAVRRLDAREQQRLLTGLVVVGCLQAVVAVTEAALVLSRGAAAPPRADALLGSSNGLGLLLVATSVLTAREIARGGGALPTAALLLQGAALVATGSRTALVVAAALLVGHAVTRPGWRLRALAATAALAAAAVSAWRVVTEPPEQRPHLWLEALRRIADRPLLGEGSPAAAYDTSTAGARVTTHAHNEVLQWSVEHGLVGVALGVLVVVLALRCARPLRHGDGWVLAAGAALATGALTDFTLRITALTLVAAALVSLSTLDRRGSGRSGSTQSRRSGGRTHPVRPVA